MSVKQGFAAVIAALMSLACFGGESKAGLIQVFGRSQLGGNDRIDWGSLGSNGDPLSNPCQVLSEGGLGVSVSKPTSSGDFQLLVQGAPGGWGGNFSPGDTVLWTNTYPNPAPCAITLAFDGPVSGVGMNIQQANALATFTGEMAAFDSTGTFLGSVSATGASNANGDGSAVFLGLASTEANIQRVVFYLTAAPFNYIGSYGVNDVSLLRPMAVPEPATLASAASACLILLGRTLLIRRRRAS